jgi:DMSO/TMAO reductase YedYZ molybdopterin-dependent catalytic subunit
LESEEVLGWRSPKRLAARTIADRHGRVMSALSPTLDQQGLITPTGAFYIVQHFAVPEPLDAADWKLAIDGHVERPRTLTYEQLLALPSRTVRALFECSGNDAQFFDSETARRTVEARRRFYPDYAGSRSDGCLLSAAEFTGVSLATVLGESGVKAGAAAVRVQGRDSGSPNLPMHGLPPSDKEIPPFNYDKGFPIEKALDADTILAWGMNGERLDHIHGAPVRLVAPGWSANWSVKWAERFEVLDRPATCWYQTEYYYFSKSADDPNREVITALPVKSMVTFPRDRDAVLTRGGHTLRGLAWSGAARISAVEVSLDDGASWHQGRIEEPRERWLWVRWSLPWEFERPGKYVILCRATDEAANVQPREPRRNYLRKNFNGIVPVEIVVT